LPVGVVHTQLPLALLVTPRIHIPTLLRLPFLLLLQQPLPLLPLLPRFLLLLMLLLLLLPLSLPLVLLVNPQILHALPLLRVVDGRRGGFHFCVSICPHHRSAVAAVWMAVAGRNRRGV